jgi:GNAT superfamily N-acetyltransferase
MRIAQLRREHVEDIAALYVRGIETGFISSFGMRFVCCLYEAVLDSPTTFGFVAVEDGTIGGFAAATTNLDELFRCLIVRKSWRLIPMLAVRLLSIRRLKNIFETLLYPSRTRPFALPQAELLAIAVAQKQRRKGIGSALMRRILAECSVRGIDRVKILVGTANKAANAFYLKRGYKLAGQIENHGTLSNIYVAGAIQPPAERPIHEIRVIDIERTSVPVAASVAEK